MPPKNKKEEIETEKEESKVSDISRLNGILTSKEHKADHYNFQERVDWGISTGSLLIDTAIGGHLNPCLLRICGDNNEGKTPMTLEIIRNFLTTIPNSKCLWDIAEGRGLSKENIERCGLTFVYHPDDWKVGTVFVLESNTFELYIKIVKELVMNNPENIKYGFVIDSLDGMQLKDDKAKEINENNKVAGTPMLSKKMLQSLSLGMFKYGHLMIIISQVTAEIKMDQYSKSPNRGGQFSGGNSLLHGSDWIFEFQKSFDSDYILDNPAGKMNDGKTKPIGKWAKIILQKSAVEASRKQKIVYPIKFGRKPSGIWLEYEIVNYLMMFSLVKQSGSWLIFSAETIASLKEAGLDIAEKIQGENNLRIYLEENPAIRDYFINKFRKVLA